MDALAGRTIPLKLGFVGVINRSQQDINVGKAIKAVFSFLFILINKMKMLDDEVKFFRDHPIYRDISDRVGTQILSLKCHKVN